MRPPNHILLTIDVEDWFQVENFKQCISFLSWSSQELRVEKNTHRLLDLLASATCVEPVTLRQRRILTQGNVEPVSQGAFSQFHPRPPRLRESNGGQEETEKTKESIQSSTSCQIKTKTPKATFFILGWLAKRLPHLVREMHSRGHEVASHGYYHEIRKKQSYDDFRKDLCDSKKLLEDIIGAPVFGYRAPSFAIDNDTLKIIEDCGYFYDSSYNSFAMHDRYGKISMNWQNRTGIAYRISSDFYELPISNLKFSPRLPRSSGRWYWGRSGRSYGVKIHDSDSETHSTGANLQSSIFNLQSLELPWGGGGYFRMIPFFLFKFGIQSILNKDKAYLFYMHPWEIDPDQPRVNEASIVYKFRHYINLTKTYAKLSKLIEHFQRCRFITCNQYLKEIAEALS